MAEATAHRPAEQLLQAADVLAQAGLLPATDGNLSVRLDERRVLLTASGVEKRNLDESSLVEVELDQVTRPRASSEWAMHRALYLARPGVGAVLHVHAPYLTTYAAAHERPRIDLLAEASLTLREIALVPYCRPGSPELGDAVVRASANATIFLLANHGAVAVGGTVREALHRLERAEFLARVDWQTRALGGGVPLSPAQIRELQELSAASVSSTE